MNLLNLFGKKKNRVPAYVPDADEYARLEQMPNELRGLYSFAKIIFFLLFPAGFALSFLSFYFFVFAACLSFIIGFRFRKRFSKLLDTRVRHLVFFALPPVCLSAGFAFGFALLHQIAKFARR